MTDGYIRKQDAVDTINENADSLEQNGVIPYAQGARAVAVVVEQIPSADVIPIKWIQKKIDKSIGMEHAMWSKLLRMWENEQLRKYVRNLKDDNK